MADSDWLARTFVSRFSERLWEEVEDSKLERLATCVAASIGQGPPEGLGTINRLGIDFESFIYAHLLEHVTFDMTRLGAWARDAFNFYRHNKDHPDLHYMFTSGVHFDLTLQNCLQVDRSTKFFCSYIMRYLKDWLAEQRQALKADEIASEELQAYEVSSGSDGVDFRHKASLESRIAYRSRLIREVSANPQILIEAVEPHFEEKFERLIRQAAEPAIHSTLSDLTYTLGKLKQKKPPTTDVYNDALAIKTDPSLLDSRGAIPFRVAGERIELSPKPNKKQPKRPSTLNPSTLKPQVDRSLARLVEQNVSDRISNTDPILRSLLEEYQAHYAQEQTETSALSLWIVGNEIEARLALNAKKDQDEQFGADLQFFLKTFLTSHDLYMQSFSVFDNIVSDLERSARMAKRLDAAGNHLQWRVLEYISNQNAILEPNTQALIRRAADATNTPNGPQTKGMVAIGAGLLRGSLRTMGLFLISKILDIAGDSVKEIGKDALKNELTSSGLQKHIYEFFRMIAGHAIQLAQQAPELFRWLGRLLEILPL